MAVLCRKPPWFPLCIEGRQKSLQREECFSLESGHGPSGDCWSVCAAAARGPQEVPQYSRRQLPSFTAVLQLLPLAHLHPECCEVCVGRLSAADTWTPRNSSGVLCLWHVKHISLSSSCRRMCIQLKPEEKWRSIKQIYDLFVPSPLPRGKSY